MFKLFIFPEIPSIAVEIQQQFSDSIPCITGFVHDYNMKHITINYLSNALKN